MYRYFHFEDPLIIEEYLFQFEPVIQPGNEGLVHHMLLYACYGEINDDTSEAWDCFNNIMPDQNKCYTTMFVWAVGGSVSD